ncbi:MAG: hypothetical protein JRH11_17455 [Deltaproteobacteria bacterium]|nr:hypothetical protein [Deltaproteobacteria bacterium]
MTSRQCSHCDEALTAINVVDQLGQGMTHSGLAFTFDEKPKTSGWSGKLKNQAGTLRAWLCESCSRVTFYAE